MVLIAFFDVVQNSFLGLVDVLMSAILWAMMPAILGLKITAFKCVREAIIHVRTYQSSPFMGVVIQVLIIFFDVVQNLLLALVDVLMSPILSPMMAIPGLGE